MHTHTRDSLTASIIPIAVNNGNGVLTGSGRRPTLLGPGSPLPPQPLAAYLRGVATHLPLKVGAVGEEGAQLRTKGED